jgi:hypothetical protein
MPRFTKKVLQRLLDQNDGFKTTTHVSQKNFNADYHYEISSGELHIREKGKTSWADSRYEKKYVADENQTRRFLKNYYSELNSDGVE